MFTSKKLFLAAAGLTTAVVAGGIVFTTTSHDITLDVDGTLMTTTVRGGTIEDVLKDKNIELEDAVVLPSVEEEATDTSKVTVRYHKPIDAIVDGSEISFTTTAVTVKELTPSLEVQGVKVNNNAYFSEKTTSVIPREGFSKALIVSNKKSLELVVGGKKQKLSTNAPTVGDVLEEQNVEVAPLDEVNHSLAAYTTPALKIQVVDIEVKTATEKEEKPLKTVVKNDKTLPEGTSKVVEQGAPAVVKKTVKLTYADGEVRSKEVVREVSVSRGATRVVLKGTKPAYTATPPGGSCAGWGPLLNKYFGGQAGKACQVMLCESGGNPKAQNPRSTASGLFQFLDSTWSSARTAVEGGSAYSRAMHAPGEMQIAAAAAWLKRTSWSQWSCA